MRRAASSQFHQMETSSVGPHRRNDNFQRRLYFQLAFASMHIRVRVCVIVLKRRVATDTLTSCDERRAAGNFRSITKINIHRSARPPPPPQCGRTLSLVHDSVSQMCVSCRHQSAPRNNRGSNRWRVLQLLIKLLLQCVLRGNNKVDPLRARPCWTCQSR